MPARPAVAETPESSDARCALMTRIVKCWGKGGQRRFAAELPARTPGGVSEALVSGWLSGKSDPGWPGVFEALCLVAQRFPEELPAIFAIVAENIDAPPEFVAAIKRLADGLPQPATDAGGDWLTELKDEAKSDLAILTAVDDCDEAALDAAIDEAHRQLEQQRTAGKREIAARRGLRVAQ